LHDQAGILAGEGGAVGIDELDDLLKSSAKARDLGRGFFAPRGLQRLAGDLVLRGRGLEGRIEVGALGGAGGPHEPLQDQRRDKERDAHTKEAGDRHQHGCPSCSGKAI